MLGKMWNSIVMQGFFLYDDPSLAPLWGENGLIHPTHGREGMSFSSNLLGDQYSKYILDKTEWLVLAYFLIEALQTRLARCKQKAT